MNAGQPASVYPLEYIAIEAQGVKDIFQVKAIVMRRTQFLGPLQIVQKQLQQGRSSSRSKGHRQARRMQYGICAAKEVARQQDVILQQILREMQIERVETVVVRVGVDRYRRVKELSSQQIQRL